MGEVFELQDVTVTRGGKDILSAVNWSVDVGEHWVVFGPNGAGKTTLVQLISARLHPSNGQVTVIGETLGATDLSQLRAIVGLSSAAVDAKLSPHDTVLDVVRTATYGMTTTWKESYEPEDDKRADYLLHLLGVQDLAQRKYGSLSSGEKKRVGIARALMPNPEVLILDEPAAGLDLGGREQLMQALTQLAADPYAPVMVLVTHHVEEIPLGFTHGLLLKDGKVVHSGKLDEVFHTQYVTSLFDFPVLIENQAGRFTARALI